MEFGKIEEKELGQLDFKLPPDPPGTQEVLKKGKGKTTFYIGCAKWGRKDWIGKLYPEGTKEKDFLHYYATQFNSIEFNGFFYNVHSREQVEKWVAAVPKGFLFCPKFTQSITHIKRLKNTKPDVDAFLDVVSAFGDHLGPIFLMPIQPLDRTGSGDLESVAGSFAMADWAGRGRTIPRCPVFPKLLDPDFERLSHVAVDLQSLFVRVGGVSHFCSANEQ